MKKTTSSSIVHLFAICFLYTTSIYAFTFGGNDTCNTALEIVCGESLNGTTLDKTDTNGVSGPDAFYRFTETTTEARDVTFSVCAAFDYDTYMRVYTSCSLTNPLANDDTCDLGSEITLTTTPGTIYYIAIEGFNGGTGNFTLTAACEGPAMPPPNDDLINAIDISNTGQGLFYHAENVDTPNATEEGGNPINCTIDGFNGVWYTFYSFEETGRINASILSPSGVQAVILFESPIASPTIDELTRIDDQQNPCFTGDNAQAGTVPEMYYFVFVTNSGNITDISIEQVILGVENSLFETFSFSPNPTSEILNLKNTIAIDQISIKNMLGATVLETTINATQATISTEHLSKGTYILTATVEGIQSHYQLIKK